MELKVQKQAGEKRKTVEDEYLFKPSKGLNKLKWKMYLSHRVRTKSSMEDWLRVSSYRRHEQQRLRKGERAGVGKEEAQISLRHCERVPWGKDRHLDWEGERGWRLGMSLNIKGGEKKKVRHHIVVKNSLTLTTRHKGFGDALV